MRPAMLRAMLAAGVAIGGLVACGGGEKMSGDEQQIRTTLTTALTSTDPSICRSHLTDNFLRQSTQETTVQAALRSCRRQLKSDQAKSVEIDSVDTRASRANAVIHTVGGVLPFEEATVSLRRADGRWRLHRLTDGTLDRPRFFQVGRDQLTSPPDELDEDTASCVLRALKEASDEQIVTSYVDGDSEFTLKPALICGIRSGLDDEGASERVQRCVSARLRRAFDAPGGDRLLDGIVDESSAAERRFTRLLESCS